MGSGVEAVDGMPTKGCRCKDLALNKLCYLEIFQNSWIFFQRGRESPFSTWLHWTSICFLLTLIVVSSTTPSPTFNALEEPQMRLKITTAILRKEDRNQKASLRVKRHTRNAVLDLLTKAKDWFVDVSHPPFILDSPNEYKISPCKFSSSHIHKTHIHKDVMFWARGACYVKGPVSRLWVFMPKCRFRMVWYVVPNVQICTPIPSALRMLSAITLFPCGNQ